MMWCAFGKSPPSGGEQVLDVEPVKSREPFNVAGRSLFHSRSGVRVVDAETGALLGPPLRHTSRIVHAALSPDGRRVITASDDNTAQVWDAGSGERVIPPLVHKATVLHAAFSGDGNRIVTSSEDRTARVWDAATGEALTPPLRHRHSVERAYFDPDDNHVVTVSSDRSVRRWDLTPDTRPVDDLVRLAQVLAGGRIDAEHGLVPLDGPALRAAWQGLRAVLPSS